MTELIDELQQRGLIQQCSNLEAVNQMLEYGLPFYLGIDPTYPSLHCGHLLPVLLAKRFAFAGHQPLLVLGSGTAKIGDPSGKTKMRKMLSAEDIATNAQAIRKQLEQVFADCDTKPIWLDNIDWLDNLNYIEFLRDIGFHFSVNRMLSFESCKQRLERGLSFIEFNYQLLQSYDYLKLFQQHDCLLQIGGDDQWGNMVSGLDLIRRYNFSHDSVNMESQPQVLTVPLVMTSSGKKMGKTENGAIFIDPKLTSPFDFFQYWRNCSDQDVERFLLLFTFLSIAKIRTLCLEGGAALNKAKEILAYEMCCYIYGYAEAEKVRVAAQQNFASKVANGGAGSNGIDNLPGSELAPALLLELKTNGISVIELYIEAGLGSSRNEVRRLIQGGGASINGQKITDTEQKINYNDLEDRKILLKAGKKHFYLFRVPGQEN